MHTYTYMSNVPMMTDLCHWLGRNRTAAANHGYLGHLCVLGVLEEHVQRVCPSALKGGPRQANHTLSHTLSHNIVYNMCAVYGISSYRVRVIITQAYKLNIPLSFSVCRK